VLALPPCLVSSFVKIPSSAYISSQVEIRSRLHVLVVVGTEFEPVDIAAFSTPPELPEVMKSPQVSTAVSEMSSVAQPE